MFRKGLWISILIFYVACNMRFDWLINKLGVNFHTPNLSCMKINGTVTLQCIVSLSWNGNAPLIRQGKQIYLVYIGNLFIIQVKLRVYRFYDSLYSIHRFFSGCSSLQPQNLNVWNTTGVKSQYTLDWTWNTNNAWISVLYKLCFVNTCNSA